MINKMFQLAQTAMSHAYVPYSKFQVGACLRTEQGDLFSGCNIENASYGLSLCAEAAAIAAMVTEKGRQTIQEIVVVSSGKETIYPCGACRQRLLEFMAEDMVCHLFNEAGEVRLFSLSQLLPSSFNQMHLSAS